MNSLDPQYNQQLKKISEDKEVIFTTIGFIILIMIHRLYGADWTYGDYRLLQLATLIIMDLYVFELLYRPEAKILLVIHRLLIIGVTLFGYYVLNVTERMNSSAESIVLLLQVTTDKMTSIDLLFNEITPTWVQKLTIFQEMLTKIGTLAWCYFMWEKDTIGDYDNSKIEKAWSIIFPSCVFILILTQAWSEFLKNQQEKDCKKDCKKEEALTIVIEMPGKN
ncbi:4059_t:CDS:2 [Acaulospora morrowiae]|uniref:4059_t:CDS:1 n=1 Tax=Acaulospora morrowiae TaxID=94023 RepID=A0A9N9CR84_9GLOM|nr:4059_t:CDS:2 [Acaulospora morrowiae]